jgi:gluconate kinase
MEQQRERRKGHFIASGPLESRLDDTKALAPDEDGVVLSIRQKLEILIIPAAAALRPIGLDRL